MRPDCLDPDDVAVETYWTGGAHTGHLDVVATHLPTGTTAQACGKDTPDPGAAAVRLLGEKVGR